MQNKITQNTNNLDALYQAQKRRRKLEAILRPDDEKFKLFMKMLRINNMLKNATVIHKKIIE